MEPRRLRWKVRGTAVNAIRPQLHAGEAGSKALGGATIGLGRTEHHRRRAERHRRLAGQATAAYLATGVAPGCGVAGGPMAEVVNHSLRHLTPEDIRAMVVYLKSVPASRRT